VGSLEARILIAVAFLLFFGLLFVYSASFPLAERLGFPRLPVAR